MNKFWQILALFVLGYSSSISAATIECTPYHSNPLNTLTAAQITTDQNIDNQEAFIAADLQIQRGQRVTRYWNLKHFPDKKLFFVCYYENSSHTISKISDAVDTCKETNRFARTAETWNSPPSFHCFKKTTSDIRTAKICSARSYLPSSLEATLKCGKYNDTPTNGLAGGIVSSGNSEARDFAISTQSIHNGNTHTNFYDLHIYKKPDLFFTCIYQDRNKVTKKIPKAMDMCKSTDGNAGCFKKRAHDARLDEWCESVGY